MRAAAFMLSALFVLAGCATQEPVKIVDAVCDSASCVGQLANLSQKSRAELDASNAARLAAEDCRRQKGVIEQQLQAVKGAQAQAEKSLAEQGATLARCQGTLLALQEKARADAAAGEVMREELQRKARADAAAGEAMRQKLQQEARADAAASEAKLRELQEKARADAAVGEAMRQELQQNARADAATSEAMRHELQQKLKAEAAAGEAKLQELQGKARADATAGEAMRQKLQEQLKADAAASEVLRQELQKYAKVAEGSAKQLQRMKDLEERLRERLQSDIGAKDVEIERLRSKLSVRVLDRILFESGSADILPRGRGVLESVATALEEGDETIRIEGHTDIVPIGLELKKKYFSNWELSTARASSVARFFLDHHGLEPTRMEAVGYSKYRPIASNDSEESRQRNRRVEIVLTPWKPEVEDAP